MNKIKYYTWDKKGSKSLVLQLLRRYGSMSRIKLMTITGLSRSKISSTISELIEMNFVQESEKNQSTGGRPSITLDLVPRSHIVLGAEFDNQSWTLAAFDLLGQTVEVIKFPTSSLTTEVILKELAENLEPFVSTLTQNPSQLLGLGMPGIIDSNKGLIRSAADLGWYNVEIAKLMKKMTGWETRVLNRHRARGLAECRYGAGKEFNEMIYVGVGSGIAAGLFLDRQLINGSVGGAGELGHITVEPHGPLCTCGNQGCLQTLCGALIIEQETRKLLRSGGCSTIYQNPLYDLRLITAEEVYQAADNGDSLCLSVIHKTASYLGIALANLVNIINPEAIILGGLMARSHKFIEIATNEMKLRAVSPLANQTVVRTATLTEYGGPLGAANFALDHYMSRA